jgi:hypothetical protein
MEILIRGARSNSREWIKAQHVSPDELPKLDKKQKAEARRGNISEEAYARTILAEQFTLQKLLQRLSRFGRWLNAKIVERDASIQIESLELDTLAGRIEVTVSSAGEKFDFEIDENLIERFLTTGSAESESAIFRLLDVYIPRQEVAKAS